MRSALLKQMAAQILSSLITVSGSADSEGFSLKVADSDLVEYSVDLALKIEAQVSKMQYTKYEAQD